MATIVELRIHGTVEMYKRGGCRCDACTSAFMAYVPHGTLSGYTHHKCRCDRCREARNAFCRATIAEPRAAGMESWTIEKISAAVSAYKARHGKYPSRESTDSTGLDGRTWATVESWLRRRHDLTIRTLMGEAPARRFEGEFEWSESVILTAALRFAGERGYWPTTKSGECADFGGRSWEAASAWLRKRGLTLAGLRVEDGFRPMLHPEAEMTAAL